LAIIWGMSIFNKDFGLNAFFVLNPERWTLNLWTVMVYLWDIEGVWGADKGLTCLLMIQCAIIVQGGWGVKWKDLDPMGIGIIMLLTEIFRQHVVRTYNPFVVTT
jgi:hypothetical protein